METTCETDNITNATSCIADTSQCTVQVCGECEYCSGVYYYDHSISEGWKMTSLCFSLSQNNCEDINASCTGTLQHLRDIDLDIDIYTCGCTGENCTATLVSQQHHDAMVSLSSAVDQPTATPTSNHGSNPQLELETLPSSAAPFVSASPEVTVAVRTGTHVSVNASTCFCVC